MGKEYLTSTHGEHKLEDTIQRRYNQNALPAVIFKGLMKNESLFKLNSEYLEHLAKKNIIKEEDKDFLLDVYAHYFKENDNKSNIVVYQKNKLSTKNKLLTLIRKYIPSPPIKIFEEEGAALGAGVAGAILILGNVSAEDFNNSGDIKYCNEEKNFDEENNKNKSYNPQQNLPLFFYASPFEVSMNLAAKDFVGKNESALHISSNDSCKNYLKFKVKDEGEYSIFDIVELLNKMHEGEDYINIYTLDPTITAYIFEKTNKTMPDMSIIGELMDGIGLEKNKIKLNLENPSFHDKKGPFEVEKIKKGNETITQLDLYLGEENGSHHPVKCTL